MHKSRSRSPITRRESPKSRESRSSSRGTFDGIDDPSPPSAVLRRSSSPPYFSCGQCRRTFDTVREISEHEIRDHESQIVCFHCEKKSITVDHLASHTKHRHPPKPVMCAYCQEPFGKSAELMTNSDWKQFRDHIEREAIRKRMYRYGTTPDTTSGQALRETFLNALATNASILTTYAAMRPHATRPRVPSTIRTARGPA
ncbi:Protein CBG15693 [Caenorhabditis briggsae]|uniref:Protein CBG15693 n=1 Tax=Caenorhabditis briggsae TaxID=6238 RepID=A8XMJ6_CAEBR|nr:Protein CBG15693 [Caenorhabditis briggsae]CAP33872.1 Protein CBG15693 [Caenorhabditis briggsae]